MEVRSSTPLPQPFARIGAVVWKSVYAPDDGSDQNYHAIVSDDKEEKGPMLPTDVFSHPLYCCYLLESGSDDRHEFPPDVLCRDYGTRWPAARAAWRIVH